MSDVKKIVPQNIRFCLSVKKMSREELSKAIHFPLPSVNSWCNGSRYPRPEALDSIAKHFGVSTAELMDEKLPTYYTGEELKGETEIIAAEIEKNGLLRNLFVDALKADPETVQLAAEILHNFESKKVK